MLSNRWWMLATALSVLSARAGLPVEEGRLADSTIEVLFADAGGGFGCTGIVNRAAGNARFVLPEAGPSLWELRFTKPDGRDRLIVDNHAPAEKLERRVLGDELRLIWRGVDLKDEKGVLDVAVSVRLRTDDPGTTEWRLQTKCRSTKWGYFETRFPCLTRVTPEKAADALFPSMSLGARLVRNYEAAKTGESFSYPGWFPMVGAYFLGEAALYIGAHDGKQLNKSILFRKNGGFQYSTEAREAGHPLKSAGSVDYPVVIAAYRGDWWPAAKRYRRWALNQPWARKGPKATRADYPKRMAEIDLWHLIEGEPKGVSNYVMKITSGDWAGFNAACEWTKWNYLPYDSNYPEMVPARKGTKEVGAWALQRGMPMMPYFNGRVWAKSLASFAYAHEDATVGPDGTHFIERYAGREFVAMCPFSKQWQKILRDHTLKAIDEVGAGAIYLDQIACSGPRLCHNPRHGHPCGGGSWWADGYRALLSPLHDALSARNIPITSEGAGDAWLDVIDGLLIANEPTDEDIPFYPAVYSDYASYFGTNFRPQGMPFDTFFRRFSRMVLWGVQPGWCVWLTYAKYAEYGKVLQAAARLRAANRKFLAYGELTGEIVFPDEPLVYATRWRTADGATLVVLANGDRQPKNVRVDGRPVMVPPLGFATFDPSLAL